LATNDRKLTGFSKDLNLDNLKSNSQELINWKWFLGEEGLSLVWNTNDGDDNYSIYYEFL